MDKVNQFNNWVDQWDKALADGIFKDIPKEDIKIEDEGESKESFFGGLNINSKSEPSAEDVSYWNDVSNYSEDTILNEGKKEEKLSNMTKKAADNANPIQIDTVGKDSKKNPAKKGFASNKALEELDELKKKLHSLENEMLTKEALGQDYKKLEKEMKKVYSIIDKVSDELNQGRFETESEEDNEEDE